VVVLIAADAPIVHRIAVSVPLSGFHPMTLFSARGLNKHYAAGVPGCSATARVLSGITLEVGPGDVIGIIGRRGSGKTTLLRCVAGLARPDAGALHWDDSARRPRFISISPAAYPFETVGDVIERTCAEPTVDPQCFEVLLQRLGLSGSLEKAQFALTTCERARLALAAGLAAPSALVLLDGASDTISAHWRPAVRALIGARAGEGTGAVLVGRDPEGVAALASTLLTLRDGSLAPWERERDQHPPARVAEARIRGTVR
jgi:ABC-type multidrug transport system ATPase subunit